MEWRQQTRVSCADAFIEAQRWIEEVTGKPFGCNDFRASLENGVLLCDLINKLKPGIIKRVNRLSTPIAGLDNVNVFLKACGKLGLNVSQLFHPGDLQDLSTRATLRHDESKRRLKNVLITIYWLGRNSQLDACYKGPQLNFKAFEGLLGLALSKLPRPNGRMENSVDPRAAHPNSEGCGSDAEAEQDFKMETTQPVTRPGQENGRDFTGPLASDEERAFDEELFLQALCEEESEDDCAEADPVRDDLYFRRVQQNLHQTSSNLGYDRFLPQYWTPEEALRVRTIYLGSQTRPWYRKLQQLRSKSLSDIPLVYPVRKHPSGNIVDEGHREVEEQWNQENKQKCYTAAKDSEAQWQDDLTKWKNRRRSTKSDLRRKSQDREHVINQMINGASTNFENNKAGGPLKRDQQSPWRNNPAPRPSSTSPPSKSLSLDLQHQTRAPLTRSYATEETLGPLAPLNPKNSSKAGESTDEAMPASDGNILGEKNHFASVASAGARVTTPSLDCPLSSQTQVKAQCCPASLLPTSEVVKAENHYTNQISTLVTTLKPNETTKSTSIKNPSASLSSLKKLQGCTGLKDQMSVSESVNQAEADAPVDEKSQEETQKTLTEPALQHDQGQQTAGVYKFLSQTGSWSRSASLPRGYRRSEGSCRLSSAITARPFGALQSRVSSLPKLCNVDDKQGLPLKSEKEESLFPPFKSSLRRQTATAQLMGPFQASAEEANQVKQNVTEQLEEVKGATFSSQANGCRYQPHTQARPTLQHCSDFQSQHTRSPTIPPDLGVDSTKVDHSDMRVSLTLKPNSRPDFGFQAHWDLTGVRVKFIQPGSPAELCRLRVDDEIVAVNGVPVAHMSYSQWRDKMASSLQAGDVTMDIRRYGSKDWSSSEGSLHVQPGQSRVTLNLTTASPILISRPNHRANTGASDKTAVGKTSEFNGQTDDVIQGRGMHGELAGNHRTAKSRGGSESAISDLQVPSLSPSSSSWSWDREEDRRQQEKWQEEQERLLQEQYQRDQERLEAEWQRAQQDAVGESCKEKTHEMTNGAESHVGTQISLNGLAKSGGEVSPDTDKLKEAGKKTPPSNALNDKRTEQPWAGDSCGFAQLSPAHRAKSMSTPVLAATHKQIKGEEKKRKGQSLSKVEMERQKILEEMKKKTPLLTDSSWIRQRSSSNSVHKEPIYLGIPLKRVESLDNLNTLRQSSPSSAAFSFPRPHSAAAGYCAPSRNSSSRYSTGTILSHRTASMDSSHHARMVSGRRTCCVCERALGSGAAMVIEALSLCFHLACFQCVGCCQHLRESQDGVQVRIRNRKAYCEPCYFQLKTSGASSVTSMPRF